jgi:1-aminocyclopropane-1-carboxylate deaminase/D-cysteine desulfhydrase-like pyridoxal-dependent ACC family enzyme
MLSENFLKIPRIPLAPLNSPVEKMERLSSSIKGAPDLYIKRDDFIGQLVWGNKLRKLEYTFAQARLLGSDTVITCGGIQSNHARTTAQIARRLGLGCVLVLNGSEPQIPTGNFRVIKMMDISVSFVAGREDRDPEMIRIAESLREQGKKPFIIPLGASDINGIPGFANAVKELCEQEEAAGISFTHIYHSTSSGGTQGGLEAGKRIFGREKLVIAGISADNSADEIASRVTGPANALLVRLGADYLIGKNDLTTFTGFIGQGYGIPTPGSERARLLFLEHEGILLDDTYTAKAADGLITHCEEGRFNKNDKVLFWHTGGLISLF